MVKRALASLAALLADAQERGLVARNVVRDLRGHRRRGKERQAERRHKAKLVVGIEIPTPREIRAIIEAARRRWRPLLITDVFTGLRASELRSLRGPMWISTGEQSMCDSAPTASTASARRNHRPVSAPFRSRGSS